MWITALTVIHWRLKSFRNRCVILSRLMDLCYFLYFLFLHDDKLLRATWSTSTCHPGPIEVTSL